MQYTKLPEELEPVEADYDHYDKPPNNLNPEDTEEYYRLCWKDYIGGSVKEDFDLYTSEMKDDWREEKQEERDTPGFKEWHEAMHDYIPTLENYITQNKEDIFNDFKDYVKNIAEPSDYFELG